MQIMCTTHSQIRPGKWGKGKREWTPGRVKWKTDHDETGATVELRSACVRVCNLWSKVCWFLKRMPIQNLIGLNKETEAFEPWCWRRLLRVPWTARRSNQSIKKTKSTLEIHWRDYESHRLDSLEGLPVLKLKLQPFGHLMQRADLFEKTLMLGKIEGRRRRGQKRMMVGWHHRLDAHDFEQALGDGDGQGSLVCCSPGDRRVGDDWEQQQEVYNSLAYPYACQSNAFLKIPAPQKKRKESRDISE